MDRSGAPQNELMAVLTAPSFNSTYLVTPIQVPMYLTLPQGISSCMALKRQISDLDRIPEPYKQVMMR